MIALISARVIELTRSDLDVRVSRADGAVADRITGDAVFLADQRRDIRVTRDILKVGFKFRLLGRGSLVAGQGVLFEDRLDLDVVNERPTAVDEGGRRHRACRPARIEYDAFFKSLQNEAT